MDCEQALEAISAALDGELSPVERAQLEEHLSVCQSCRALAEDFRVLSAALDAAGAAPPPELATGVMARIAAEGKVTPISALRRRGARRWLGLAAMLALVICAGGLGLWLRGTDRIMAANQSVSGGAPPPADPGGVSAGQEDLARAYFSTNGFSEPAACDPAPSSAEGSAVADGGGDALDKLYGSTPEVEQSVVPIPAPDGLDIPAAPPPAAIITFERLPEGWEELFPGVASPDAMQISAEEARAFLQLLEEQGITSEISGSIDEDGLCQLLLAED